jgi:CheY-like chemotaxis protein/mannose-6-phosphate isomerase-like protein (cupin superfamily)
MTIVEHPWGTAETWASTDLFTARTLVIRAGASLGPASDPAREASFRVQRGNVSVKLEGEPRPRELRAGEVVHVAAGIRHTLHARAEVELTEVTADRSRSPRPPVSPLGRPDPEYVIDDAQIMDAAAAAVPRPAVDRPGAAVIVIVEDDLLIQDILVRAFGGTYTIHRADDGAQGLALIEALPPVDLVITDLMMPRMNGLDLLRRLKADPLRKQVPVIMLTARATSGDVATAINAGAKSYVTKPFKLKELIAQVNKIISTTRVANAPSR